MVRRVAAAVYLEGLLRVAPKPEEGVKSPNAPATLYHPERSEGPTKAKSPRHLAKNAAIAPPLSS